MNPQPRNPFLKAKEPTSIIEVIGGPEAQGLTDRDYFMAEIQLFSELKGQKILEKEDRQKIDNFKKNSVKGILIANVLAGVLNRLITKIKFKKFDFMNWHFIFRFPVRVGIFLFLNLQIFNSQMFKLIDLREDLNMKYIPRYQEYMKTGGHPMSVLNKKYLEDPDVTQEEKDTCARFQKASQGGMIPGMFGGPRI